MTTDTLELDPAVAEQIALFDRREELRPVLPPYLETNSRSGLILRHPLVYSIHHTDKLNASCNGTYRWKRKYLAEARGEGDWSLYIHLHERPYRLEALLSIARELDDRTYWSLVGDVWTDTGNAWQCRREWRGLWSGKRQQREYAMDDAERDHFASLPEVLTIYRGVNRKRAFRGLSWVAYFACRSEQEIVVNPAALRTLNITIID